MNNAKELYLKVHSEATMGYELALELTTATTTLSEEDLPDCREDL